MEEVDKRQYVSELVTLEQAKKLDQLGFDGPVIVAYDENGTFQGLRTGSAEFILLSKTRINSLKQKNKIYRAPRKVDAILYLEKFFNKIALYIPIGNNYVCPIIADLSKEFDIIETLDNIKTGYSMNEAIDHVLNEFLDFHVDKTIIHEKKINNK